MKTALPVLALLVVPVIVCATEQVPDILNADGLKLSLRTGWGHPSPLETYYHQNRLAYPFESHSTANYRGHVATWEIVDGRLHLTSIGIERYEPNAANPRSFTRVVESHKPGEYGVKPRSRSRSQDGGVLADWFSGVLDCWVRTEGDYRSYFYRVQDGNVVDRQIVTGEDRKVLNDPRPADTWTEDLKKKYNMLRLNENYITYYFRLNESDEIQCQGQDCRLDTDCVRLSPIFGRFGNSHSVWPYNWRNKEQCGAPHCRWLVRDGRLHLVKVELHSGLLLDKIDTETLNLEDLFPGEVAGGEVLASWVSGVYVAMHGEMTADSLPADYEEFKVTELTYMRIKDGTLIETYTIPRDFDTENMPADTDPGLRRIIEDYELPSAMAR